MKNAEKIFKKADFAEICMKQIISKMQGIVRKKQVRQAMEWWRSQRPQRSEDAARQQATEQPTLWVAP